MAGKRDWFVSVFKVNTARRLSFHMPVQESDRFRDAVASQYRSIVVDRGNFLSRSFGRV
jgi:hypothetical protein